MSRRVATAAQRKPNMPSSGREHATCGVAQPRRPTLRRMPRRADSPASPSSCRATTRRPTSPQAVARRRGGRATPRTTSRSSSSTTAAATAPARLAAACAADDSPRAPPRARATTAATARRCAPASPPPGCDWVLLTDADLQFDLARARASSSRPPPTTTWSSATASRAWTRCRGALNAYAWNRLVRPHLRPRRARRRLRVQADPRATSPSACASRPTAR